LRFVEFRKGTPTFVSKDQLDVIELGRSRLANWRLSTEPSGPSPAFTSPASEAPSSSEESMNSGVPSNSPSRLWDSNRVLKHADREGERVCAIVFAPGGGKFRRFSFAPQGLMARCLSDIYGVCRTSGTPSPFTFDVERVSYAAATDGERHPRRGRFANIKKIMVDKRRDVTNLQVNVKRFEVACEPLDCSLAVHYFSIMLRGLGPPRELPWHLGGLENDSINFPP
jgi:hypothetical protein